MKGQLVYDKAKLGGECHFCGKKTKIFVHPSEMWGLIRSPTWVCQSCKDTDWKQEELKKVFGLKTDEPIIKGNDIPVVRSDDIIRPQKGKDLKHLKDTSVIFNYIQNWCAEQKIDGTRVTAYIGREQVRFLTSRISKKTGQYRDVSDRVPHLQLALPELEGTVLDGEMVSTASSLDTGAVGSLTSTTTCLNAGAEKSIAIQKRNGKLKFVVFDCLRYRGADLLDVELETRQKTLDKAMNIIGEHEFWEQIEVHKFSSAEQLKQLFEETVAQGLEGLMLKNLRSVHYAPSKSARTKGWVKWKKTVTYDGFITGFKEGEGEDTGFVGVLYISGYNKAGEIVEFASVSNLSQQDKKDLTVTIDGEVQLRRDYFKKVVEVKGQEFTKNNRLRHALILRWRGDKNAETCSLPF